MENIPYKIIALVALVIIVLGVIVGVMVPGSPLKSMISNINGNAGVGDNKNQPTVMPSSSDNWTERPIVGPPDLSSSSEYLTLSKALGIVKSNGSASSWFSSHDKWTLANLYANHMNSQGVAFEWMNTYVSGRDVMMVNIRGGNVVSVNVYTSSSSVTLGMSLDGLQDSPTIMNDLISRCSGFQVSDSATPFSLSLHPGQNATYVVNYVDLIDISNDFSATYDARSGELLNNTYRVML